ncbi:MAG: hypothetical protein K0S11_1327 [Gammaproteobacteria bacterium]|jgi:hypothetical protein|nr:hypothetical protein [Gammaproteobacteria bacterium]
MNNKKTLINCLTFISIFIGLGTLFSLKFFGLTLFKDILFSSPFGEKSPISGTGIYLGSILACYLSWLLLEKKLANKFWPYIFLGLLTSLLALPFAFTISTLLKGLPFLSFEAFGASLILPFLFTLMFFILPQLGILPLTTGVISGIIYYFIKRLSKL